ncbi:uncharacterized protein PG986_012569 [Apiospora aurea]|uniref:F-box domain-containing protein n=1 Tax=Apiospora aurea TaxID=335848 RepID=A0ABR1Q0D0_9PEZI
MVGLLELPLELFLEITGYINTGQEWKTLAAVNRGFYYLAIKRFWDSIDQDKRNRIFMWACAAGSTRALNRLLESRQTPNLNLQPSISTNSMSRVLTNTWEDTPSFPYMDNIHAVGTSLHWNSCWKPLHVAVRHGRKEIVETLLHHGAWIDAVSKNYCCCKEPSTSSKYTALHLAICTGQEEIAHLLLANKTSIYVDQNGHDGKPYGQECGRITALHFCAIHGSLATAKAIIEGGHKAVINEQDEDGWSAIAYAYRNFKDDVFDYLLAEGASTLLPKMNHFWFRANDNPTASELLHQACLESRWDVVIKLVHHGSDPSKPDRAGRQPLRLCLDSPSFQHSTRLSWDYHTDHTIAVSQMVDAIKVCKMHLRSQRRTLLEVMEYALGWPTPALVSLLLDAGIESSTMLEGTPFEIRPPFPLAQIGSEDFHYDSCFFDTGRGARRCPNTRKRLRTTNLRAPRHYNSQPTCSFPPALELFYICLDRGQYGILEELAKVVDFAYTECTEQQMWFFFSIVTSTWWIEDPTPLIDRRLRCLKFLFQLGGSEVLLRSSKTFKELCHKFLDCSSGEEATLDYLDSGGCYHFDPLGDRTALFYATHHGCAELTKRLLDLGEDPNRLMVSHLDPEKRHYGPDAWEGRWGDDVGVLRALLERGGNPFRSEGDRGGIGFPFGTRLKQGGRLGFFRELCKLTISNETDDADLFDILEIACDYGRYEHIQILPGYSIEDYDYPQQVDEAIDTIGLILQLGGSEILTSSWRLKRGRPDFTALKVLKKLLAPAPEDLAQGWTGVRMAYIHVCLNQRIKIVSGSHKNSVTILGGKIDWKPSMGNGPYGPPEDEGEEEVEGPFSITRELYDKHMYYMGISLPDVS